MQQLEAVIFDMDGVLVDSEAAYRRVHEAFFEAQGVEVSSEEFDMLAGSSGLRMRFGTAIPSATARS